jgi:predicted aconitase with swiveling domain
MGPKVTGEALVATDGFSARYDLDRIKGVFSRPSHALYGTSYVGRVLVLDRAKGGVASAWMFNEMVESGRAPRCWPRAPPWRGSPWPTPSRPTSRRQ